MAMSKTTGKIVAAIAATLMAELTGKLLDSTGLSQEESRLARDIIKAVTAAVGGLLVDRALTKPDRLRTVSPDVKES